MLTTAKKRYWPTELEVAGLVWAIRKLRQLIEASQIPTIFYTDHSATAGIAKQASLNTTSMEPLNLRLIRASIPSSSSKVYHCPGKTNTVADALSRLPALEDTSSPYSIEDIEVGVNLSKAEERPPVILVEMSAEFKKKLQDGYSKDTRWSQVLEMLRKEESSGDPEKPRLPYEVHDGLLYSKNENGTSRLCIPQSVVLEVFQLVRDRAGHQGFDRCYERLAGLAIYNLNTCIKLLKSYIHHCQFCRQNKTARQYAVWLSPTNTNTYCYLSYLYIHSLKAGEFCHLHRYVSYFGDGRPQNSLASRSQGEPHQNFATAAFLGLPTIFFSDIVKEAYNKDLLFASV